MRCLDLWIQTVTNPLIRCFRVFFCLCSKLIFKESNDLHDQFIQTLQFGRQSEIEKTKCFNSDNLIPLSDYVFAVLMEGRSAGAHLYWAKTESM